jgi:hypothetical protein
MKKIICLFIIVCMCMSLCGCLGVVDKEPNEQGVIGYVIVPHHDGDEHIPITDYYYSYGTMTAYCADGRTIVSTQLIIVIE